MKIALVLTAHIAVLGYWLGAELVINSLYRYVCYSDQMPFTERGRLMARVMRVDQHVRYALVLQLSLGSALAAIIGYVPGGATVAWTALVAGGVWLLGVELLHQCKATAFGRKLTQTDHVLRYALMILLVVVGTRLIVPHWPIPAWLAAKLILFAGVIGCGIGIRFALISHFRTWAEMERDGPDELTNKLIKKVYVRATSILVLLWIFIAAIVMLSVVKPVFTF